ncbi:MAG: DUF2029 domain-containing protein [Propionibacteriaceae bacterium]|nr:DUF2029 domain-containing protein [Propionibacteriaceae bacterium]
MRPGQGPVQRLLLPLALFILAFSVRLFPMLAGGGPYPVDNYDPSVYYAAAVGLFEGRLPYRDFLLLHPPGLLLFLQPFAALGSVVGEPTANLVARTAFMALGAFSTVLVYRIVLPRSAVAAMLASGLYLVYFPAIYSERTTRLEGLASFLVLAGLAVLGPLASRGVRLLAVFGAGLLFGLAATVKIWGVALLLALGLWVLLHEGLRAALVATAGGALAGLVVIGPFAVQGPQFWRMVVLDQVGRPELAIGPVQRLNDIFGLYQLGGQAAEASGQLAVPPGVTLALGAVLGVLIAGAVVDRAGRLYVFCLAAALITLLAGPSWFAHYPTLAIGPMALVLGTAAGRLTAVAGRVGRAVLAVVVAVLVGLGSVWQLGQPEGKPFAVTVVSEALRDRAGCVTTDNPVSLILSDTLRRNLRRGCPLVVDLSGYLYDILRARGGEADREDNPAFQRELIRYLGSGETTVIMRLWPDSFDAASRAEVERWPVLVRFDGHTVREPR